MSTYKILSNVLDFLEEKNKLSMSYKLPPDEEVEVSYNGVIWKRKYPKIESPEQKDEGLNKLRDDSTYDIIKFSIDSYYHSDRRKWNRSVDVYTSYKGVEEHNCSIPLYWWNRFNFTILRAKFVFLKIERDATRCEMLRIDKNMAKINSNRIDEILKGTTDEQKDGNSS